METPPAFDVPFASRTLVGSDCANLAGVELARLGVTRAGVVASRSVAASQAFQRWRDRLGGDHILFTDVSPHTPRDAVVSAIRTFRAAGCDGVVSFGGGSSIDTAKGAALGLATGIDDEDELDDYVGERENDGSPRPFRLDVTLPAHVAIPTTLSGAAHTHSAGISDASKGEKVLHIHPSLGPRTVLLDPVVTLETPTDLWTSTGVKALEHAVESLYSRSLPLLLEPIRMRAFTILTTDLVRTVGTASKQEILKHRARVLAGAGMSVFAWPSGPLGVSHALGHQAGATWHIRHGHSAAIFLPHALAFNAPAAESALCAMALALGARDPDPLAAVLGRLAEISEHLQLPTRLRDVGVESTEAFDRLAKAAIHDPIMAGNPRPITRDDLLELLHAAY